MRRINSIQSRNFERIIATAWPREPTMPLTALPDLWGKAVEAIRLMALTGCRRGEFQRLRRTEVDVAGQALRLGDTKTGYSVRPIGLAAVRALNRAMERTKSEFVFPAIRSAGYFQGVDKCWRTIAGRTLPKVSPHVLRHSFASTADDVGRTIPTIAALLGHSATGSATLGYIHKVDAALISAANRVAEKVLASMDGDAPDESVAAVPLGCM